MLVSSLEHVLAVCHVSLARLRRLQPSLFAILMVTSLLLADGLLPVLSAKYHRPSAPPYLTQRLGPPGDSGGSLRGPGAGANFASSSTHHRTKVRVKTLITRADPQTVHIGSSSGGSAAGGASRVETGNSVLHGMYPAGRPSGRERGDSSVRHHSTAASHRGEGSAWSERREERREETHELDLDVRGHYEVEGPSMPQVGGRGSMFHGSSQLLPSPSSSLSSSSVHYLLPPSSSSSSSSSSSLLSPPFSVLEPSPTPPLSSSSSSYRRRAERAPSPSPPHTCPGPDQIFLSGSPPSPLSPLGQCEFIHKEYIQEVCERTPPLQRLQRLRNVNLNFCDAFHVEAVTYCPDGEAACPVAQSPSVCTEYLEGIRASDDEAREGYRVFLDLLERYDCRSRYSVKWNCTHCKRAYKEWLCSQTIPVFQRGQLVPPCSDFCAHVQEMCPFFRPIVDTHAGDPSFICKDPEIHLPPPHHGLTCYKPCHIIAATDMCETFCRRTPNCTDVSYSPDSECRMLRHDCPHLSTIIASSSSSSSASSSSSISPTSSSPDLDLQTVTSEDTSSSTNATSGAMSIYSGHVTQWTAVIGPKLLSSSLYAACITLLSCLPMTLTQFHCIGLT